MKKKREKKEKKDESWGAIAEEKERKSMEKEVKEWEKKKTKKDDCKLEYHEVSDCLRIPNFSSISKIITYALKLSIPNVTT